MNPPLSGVRVLDLTRHLPGPLASLHLAMLGAEVVKVEAPQGDEARAFRFGALSLHDLVGRGKRSLRLDLKQPAGRDALLRLARDADVLIEGFRPGVAQRLGIGYEALRAVNARLVYCSITGYGQHGPLAQRPGHDLNYIAHAGVLDQTGAVGGPPAVPNLQIGDLLGGAAPALVGVLAALLRARISGTGAQVDVSMTDAVLAQSVFALLEACGEGRASARGAGIVSGGLACYAIYASADGRHLTVAALERKFWDTLCDALGCPELKPQHLATGDAAATVRARLAAIFVTQPLAYWRARLEPLECCVAALLRPDECLTEPHFAARASVRTDADGAPALGAPFHLDGSPLALPPPAPALGADSETLLLEAGYAPEEIAALRAQGVI